MARVLLVHVEVGGPAVDGAAACRYQKRVAFIPGKNFDGLSMAVQRVKQFERIGIYDLNDVPVGHRQELAAVAVPRSLALLRLEVNCLSDVSLE